MSDDSLVNQSVFDGEHQTDDQEYFHLLDELGDCDEDGSILDDAPSDDIEDDCGPIFDAVTGKARASDEDLRAYAFSQTLCHLATAACPSGNRGRCRFGGSELSKDFFVQSIEEVFFVHYSALGQRNFRNVAVLVNILPPSSASASCESGKRNICEE